ncbi:trafficking protein particle complex subunit 2-like protein [Caerostris darwini]|uniref:Trafficking protein particle complex subunit 2-like protein n=1 Tax=Caerostris darwini TaxID=1538125 RepID=A0AAV4P5B6_9ARAC|nr:trafficking protein particle complex subunit 2-like protein [Caerostris darwini]
MAAAIAVISKENYPLYVKTSSPGNDLKFLYTIHTSLDVIEEKVLTVNKATSDLRELYLGLLYPTEDYKVYGYVTNTKIKFIVVVESSHTTLRDNEIRQMFRRIHASYADMVCNPFYTAGEVISSKSFEAIIKSIMSTE